MAVSLSQNFVTLFDAEVKQAFQATQMLAGTCRTRTGVEGSTVQFPKIGKGVAALRIPQTDVVPLNIVSSNVTCTMSDFAAPEYSDIFDQSHINYSERNELVQVVGSAIGRRADQLKIDALNASSTSLTVANSIGGSTTNMNLAKLREAAALLNTNNVPKAGRHLLMHADQLNNLLSETAVTSVDFASTRALVDGQVNQFLGFTIHTIGDMDEGGLPKDGSNDRTCFAWHESSLGYAESISQRTEINYVPEKTSFLVNAILSAGSVAIDDEGICKITCRES